MSRLRNQFEQWRRQLRVVAAGRVELGRIILAVAVAPGQALVGPEAEQLKAAARSPNSNLALR